MIAIRQAAQIGPMTMSTSLPPCMRAYDPSETVRLKNHRIKDRLKLASNNGRFHNISFHPKPAQLEEQIYKGKRKES